MVADRRELLTAFSSWVAQHIKGDEKGEAQIFFDRLFGAFGQRGLFEAGGQAEVRIRKAGEDGGGTSFADCVWKPIVLIEMKKRGADLARHYRQAFDYWTRLVPGRPQYVVLCNFDEFWVYDFNNQLDSPKDIVKVAELPDRFGPLAFLFPTQEKPSFGNDREAVTREAADKLALLFRKLTDRKIDRGLAQRFTLQSLVALFAEDIGLLPRYLFDSLLADCKNPADSYDLIGGLFEAMNTRDTPAGGRYKGVRYFNGGIFDPPARLELYEDEVNQLKGAATSDWSKVSPEIFGAIFQDSMEAEERHAYGAHYTSPVDIMKIVKPTIADPWADAIEGAKSSKRLGELLERLTTLRVLDPACGSGNFLYLAYREMKRLEGRIRERLTAEFPEYHPRLIHVNARQFYGMDINSFAIELAKVALMIGRKLAVDELKIGDENPLPLDNLDANFHAVDALLTTQSAVGTGQSAVGAAGKGKPYANVIQTSWPAADVIIGNPPFLGAKRLKPERGVDYVNALRKLYPEVPGMADYCVYWFRRAHDHLPQSTAADPLAGRAGLVGTQNIRNNQSRVGGLDYIAATGTILEAVDNQPWSGEANVHVSIVNWMKTTNESLLPKQRRLWTIVDKTTTRSAKRGFPKTNRAAEPIEQLVREIPASLSLGVDYSARVPLECNRDPQRTFQGKVLGYEGFLLSREERDRLYRDSADVIYPIVTGRELLDEFRIKRWVIDFRNMPLIEAQKRRSAFEHCRACVLPDVEQKVREAEGVGSDMLEARREHLQRWWQFWNRRDELNAFLDKHARYIA
ncbi:MAG TPA: DNA methyltransferase, partial [Tepidisphaeraceae bacterium]